MLVLSRRVGERIVIDENVTVTIIGRRGRQVCLGIEAPLDVSVRRHELPPRDGSAIEHTKCGRPCTPKPR